METEKKRRCQRCFNHGKVVPYKGHKCVYKTKSHEQKCTSGCSLITYRTDLGRKEKLLKEGKKNTESTDDNLLEDNVPPTNALIKSPSATESDGNSHLLPVPTCSPSETDTISAQYLDRCLLVLTELFPAYSAQILSFLESSQFDLLRTIENILACRKYHLSGCFLPPSSMMGIAPYSDTINNCYSMYNSGVVDYSDKMHETFSRPFNHSDAQQQNFCNSATNDLANALAMKFINTFCGNQSSLLATPSAMPPVPLWLHTALPTGMPSTSFDASRKVSCWAQKAAECEQIYPAGNTFCKSSGDVCNPASSMQGGDLENDWISPSPDSMDLSRCAESRNQQSNTQSNDAHATPGSRNW